MILSLGQRCSTLAGVFGDLEDSGLGFDVFGRDREIPTAGHRDDGPGFVDNELRIVAIRGELVGLIRSGWEASKRHWIIVSPLLLRANLDRSESFNYIGGLRRERLLHEHGEVLLLVMGVEIERELFFNEE